MQQALKYEIVSSYLRVVIMILLISLATCVAYYFWKNRSLDKFGSMEVSSFLGIFIPCLATPAFFLQLCYLIDKLLKIYIAPKFFLIGLVSSMKEWKRAVPRGNEWLIFKENRDAVLSPKFHAHFQTVIRDTQ